MATKSAQPWSGAAWALARRQHGVVARWQLLELGMSGEAIRHRLRNGRMRRVRRGVYLVGGIELTRHGRWRAALLACGPEAVLSHRAAAELWGLAKPGGGTIDVTVPAGAVRRQRGVRVHRRTVLEATEHARVPVTGLVVTLVDFATVAGDGEELEAAVNEACQRDRIDPERLRAALGRHRGRPGVRRLRDLLERDTFVLTESALERRFLPLARAAGLPLPESQQWLGRHRVDFHWPALGLVVECDGLTYHRTAIKQTADLRRDQAHSMAGRWALRFSHHQVHREADYVVAVLRGTATQLGLSPGARSGGAPRGGGGAGRG